MTLQESGEMYLEAILMLSRSGHSVRSVDVGEYMGYSKPSVSRAIGLLKESQYVEVAADGQLCLTTNGRLIAEKIYERHVHLTRFLMALGVSEETAARDACRMEHVISDESFAALKRHMSNFVLADDDSASAGSLKRGEPTN